MDEFRQAISRLTRYEKISAILLVLFGIAALTIGVTQMRTRILNIQTNKKVVEVSDLESMDIEQLMQQQDTDSDGLTDFDEINIYKTSPYLSDSDSDGLTDSEEVNAGENPNCPKGEVCFGAAADTETSGGVVQVQQPAGQPTDVDEILGMFGSGENFDVQALKQALAEAGVDPVVLEEISDEDLKQMYEQTLANGAVTQDTTPQSPGQADLTQQIAEVRQIMIQSGVDPEEVASFTDEEILELMGQAAAELENQQNQGQ